MLSEDLATLRHRPLSRWPPGYSVTLWGLHSLGLDWMEAAFAFKTAVLLLAIVGWFWMAWRMFDSPVLAAMLMVLGAFPVYLQSPRYDLLCAGAFFSYRVGETERQTSLKRPAADADRACIDCLCDCDVQILRPLPGRCRIIMDDRAVVAAGETLDRPGARRNFLLPALAPLRLPDAMARKRVGWPNLGLRAPAPTSYAFASGVSRRSFPSVSYRYFPAETMAGTTGRGAVLTHAVVYEALDNALVIPIVVFLLGVLIYYRRMLEKNEEQRIRLGLLVLGCVASGVFLVAISVLYQASFPGFFATICPWRHWCCCSIYVSAFDGDLRSWKIQTGGDRDPDVMSLWDARPWSSRVLSHAEASRCHFAKGSPFWLKISSVSAMVSRS